MKKIAQNKSPKKVFIPPDILDDKTSNKAEHPEEVDVEKEPKETAVEPNKEIGEMPFYEKVTGEKLPQKAVPDINIDAPLEIDKTSQEESLPQIERKNKKLFLLGGIVFLLTIVLTTVIGFIIFNTSDYSKEAVVEEPKEREVDVSPTPVAIDKSEWTFEVLNGSGEAGKAKKAADAIEAIGYTVDGTGNAKNSDYTSVTVSFIKEIDERVRDIILTDLRKEFQSVRVEDDAAQLSESSILLIIGK